jgi:hypothetical protein
MVHTESLDAWNVAARRELSLAAPVSVGMNTPPRKNKSERRSGAPESAASNETFPRRTDPPGEAGLANETRPGLGTRRDEPFPGEPPRAEEGVADPESSREPNDKPVPREPQEQMPDSWAHEAERQTGVSGHLGSS